MKRFDNRVAFVTGGASGIGLGMAIAFADAGMRVVIADLRQDHIDTASAAFARRGRSDRLHAIRVDVTDRDALAAAADEAERVFGPVHVLVNNAGVGIQGPFEGISYHDWDFGLAVNLGGVINGLQTFLPRMRAHGEGGHVINTASLAALVPMPAQFAIYATAKAAVVALSETLREELPKHGIGVSVLCPGPVSTNIHELVKNRPPHHRAGEAYGEFERAGGNRLEFPGQLEPEAVAAMVLEALRDERFWVITHGEWRDMAIARHREVVRSMPDHMDPELMEMIHPAPSTGNPGKD